MVFCQTAPRAAPSGVFVRVIAGTAKGRRLRVPAGLHVRPSGARLRESAFGILEHRGAIEGARVLDLFAGTGALGIEALSRGAAHATFVDAGKPALAAIRGNLHELGLEDRADVVALDAVAAAGRPPAAPWDLVFVDPPYASDLARRAVAALPAAGLAPGAVVVIEHDRRGAPPDALGFLLRTDQRRYGDTMVSFFEVPA